MARRNNRRAQKGQGYIFKRGASYWLQYMVEGKRVRVSLGIISKPEAIAERDRILAGVPREATRKNVVQALTQSFDSEQVQIPLTEVWDRWIQLTDRAPSPRTRKGYLSAWNGFLDWAQQQPGGPREVGHLAQSRDGFTWAERFRIHMDTLNLAPSTFNQHLGTLRNMWDTLKVGKNPWRDIKLKKLTNRIRSARKHSPFTPAEVRKILETATGDFKTLIELGIYTGQRLYDCVNLQWEAIDWEHNVIRLTQRKTGTPVVVPILPSLRAALKALPRGSGPVLPDLAKTYQDDNAAISKTFSRILKNCGIKSHKPADPDQPGRRIPDKSFHSLRHTFITECRKLGFEEAHIAAVVGHESLEMTRHYTQISADEMIRLSERFAGTAPTPPADPVAEPANIDLPAWIETLRTMKTNTWRKLRNDLIAAMEQSRVEQDSKGT